MSELLRFQYSQNRRVSGSSGITELLKNSQRDGIISFAGGFPAAELFPADEFKEASHYVLSYQSHRALQYGSTPGFDPLREFLARKMSARGVKAAMENILITSGSQQSLDLIGRLFLNNHDRLLCEKPTFIGALQAWRPYQVEYVAIPMDEDGLVPEHLENGLECGPKFLYTMPDFHNPTGICLSLQRRLSLLALLDKTPIPIVEDDPYSDLRFDGDELPSLISLDGENSSAALSATPGRGLENGKVIYLGTFSKILAPGLRLGWMVASSDFIQDAAQIKQGVDLQSSSLTQMITYQLIKDGFLDIHIQRVKAVYRQRRDLMLEAMQHEFPASVSWTHPMGGLFLWVWLPEGLDASNLLIKAMEKKVAYVPGSVFFPDGSGQNSFRLNFSNSQPEQIQQGILRLGEVLTLAVDEHSNT